MDDPGHYVMSGVTHSFENTTVQRSQRSKKRGGEED